MFRHWTKAVKATHTPTGVSVVIEGGPRDAMDNLIKRAKVVVAMRVQRDRAALAEVHTYDLPDDEPYPNELGTFRGPAGLTPQNVIGRGPGGNLT